MTPALFVYCNAFIVLWTGSVVSLLYGTVYNSVSCAWFWESFWLLYCCLLQIIIVEFLILCAQSLGLSQGCALLVSFFSLLPLVKATRHIDLRNWGSH